LTIYLGEKAIALDNMPPTFSDLQLDICLAFGPELPRHYTIKYLDPDGDLVTVGNDEDFKMMRETCKTDVTIYVTANAKANAAYEASCKEIAALSAANVQPQKNMPSDEKPSEVILHQDSKKGPEMHSSSLTQATVKNQIREEQKQAFVSALPAHVYPNTTCCGCKLSPVVGVCYVCSVCPGFLLCHACEARFQHPHAFLKVDHPSKLVASHPAPNTGFHMPSFDLNSVKEPVKKFLNTTVEFMKDVIPGLGGSPYRVASKILLQYPARAEITTEVVYVAVELYNCGSTKWPEPLCVSTSARRIPSLAPMERHVFVAQFDNGLRQVGTLKKHLSLITQNERQEWYSIGDFDIAVSLEPPMHFDSQPHERAINQLLELGVQTDTSQIVGLVAGNPGRSVEELGNLLMESP
jgi:hypothetical protein